MSITASSFSFTPLHGRLWAVPGPVWLALTARALSGGFAAAWPLAIGVALGDHGLAACGDPGPVLDQQVYGDFLQMLRWVAAVFSGDGGDADPQPARPSRPTAA